jgi:hypothetical protein
MAISQLLCHKGHPRKESLPYQAFLCLEETDREKIRPSKGKQVSLKKEARFYNIQKNSVGIRSFREFWKSICSACL